MDVRGKVALVTGGGSGIGRATARLLAAEGATVYVLDRDAAGAVETADAIAAAGGSAVAVSADVTDEAGMAAVIDRAEREHGGLDILVNNAGVTTSQPPFPQTPSDRWARTLEINLRAVILGTQLAIPALIRRGGGAITHTASMAGIMGFPPDPVYAASKGGVVLFTRSLAPMRETHNIRVNCVCPGFVDTPMLHRVNHDVDEAARREREVMLAGLPKLGAEDIAAAHLQLIQDEDAAGQALRAAFGMPRSYILAPLLDDLMNAG